MQQSTEWMRDKADKLKEDVCTLFTPTKDILRRMYLVDEIVHLGIDHLFEKEIETALKDIHETEFASSNLHEVALRFRLLRERGFWVSPDIFNKFKGDDGNFLNEFAEDPRSLLSLYNAAHLFIHGEPELEDAISFARNHLESMSSHSVLKAPLADQVKRHLRLPLPRTHKRVEMLHYMFEYDQENEHNPVLLELAKLDFNLLQQVHLKELKEISRWWKDVLAYMGLDHIRDRVIECYTWSYAVYHEKDLALARMIFAKLVALTSVLDDTYDVHAYTSIEECRMLNVAIQGWDDSAALLVPEYLRKFYEIILRTFREFEDQIPRNQRYLAAFSKAEFQKLTSNYLEAAEWYHRNHKPSFNDQVALGTATTGTRSLAAGLMLGMGDAATTKQAFQWAVTSTDAIISCGKIGRLMNDISGFKLGSQNKADMACAVEAYIEEHKVTADVAIARINEVLEEEWKTTNQARVDHRAVLPVVQRMINITLGIQLFYGNDSDAFTFGKQLQEVLEDLYVKPMPLL
uniref:Terpene synthase n=2 Tax=Oryza glaberrima TaxID=4538 RepID=I1PK85_ORYGL